MKKNCDHKNQKLRIIIYILLLFVSYLFFGASSNKTYAGCTYYCASSCSQNWPFQWPDQCTDESYMGCDGGGWKGCCLIGSSCTWTASFNGNGGSCTPTSRGPVAEGSSVLGSTCTRSGYNFTSFTINVPGNCIGFNTSTGACGNIQGDFTATAQWVLANSTPTEPTSLLTEGYSNPNGITDLTPEFSAIYNDPDSGDIADYYEIEVNTNSSFTGTLMWDTGKASMANLTAGYPVPDKSYAGTALSLNGTTYYWRIRFWDDSGAQGAWSATANFTMNTPPTAPTSLLCEGATNPTGVTDLTPEFSAIFNDPNTGQTGNWYRIEVNTNSTFSGTVMWDSGLVAMTATAIGARSPDISYAGTALSLNGTTYYWRIRFADNVGTTGAVSTESAYFTMNNLPYATDLTTETYTNPIKIYDTTPEFSARFNDADTGSTGIYYQINVNTSSAFNGTSMWDSTKTAMTAVPTGSLITEKSYAGTTLTLNGSQYFWRIKFWDENNSEGAWSSTANFRMSGPPNAPTDLLLDGQTNPLYLNSVTPTFSAVYTDINTDNSASYEIEVNTQSDFLGTVMWDTGQLSTTITSGNRSTDFVYAGTALTGTSNITYYWRIRFWDIDSNVSDWSTGSFRDSLMHLYLNGLRLNGIRLD